MVLPVAEMNDVSAPRLAVKDGAQPAESLSKNRTFFAKNDAYRTGQDDLETYRLIALAATQATKGARRLLDIGNGGVFPFAIDDIPDVTAADIFIDDAAVARYPRVRWIQASALELPFDAEFDTAIEINTLHHIIGSTVAQTYANLDMFFRNVNRSLVAGGRCVVIESTVPRWFLGPYKLVFPFLQRVWPLAHPPTFQFHYEDIGLAARRSGFDLEEFCWVPKVSDVLSLGFRLKPWMTPVKIAKMVFRKPPR
jgi:SAM-dependent methyltransferase